MELNTTDQKIKNAAIEFAKKNKTKIAKEFTDPSRYATETDPVSVFMAGSPGAGKTEASKALLDEVGSNSALRIDPDAFRAHFTGYNGSNSYLFQHPISILVDKIHDLALKRKLSFILDGTLTKLDKATENINRSIQRERTVQILYVYQDPLLAWSFVMKREDVEGRRIPVERFIEQYFAARKVVNQLKLKFKNQIKVDLLLKNNDGSQRMYEANINNIDHHITEKYTKNDLEIALKTR